MQNIIFRIMRIFLVFISIFLPALFNVNAIEISTSKWPVIKEQLDKLEPGDLLVSDVMGVIYYQGDRLISLGNKDIYKSFLQEVEKKEGTNKKRMLEGLVKKSYVPLAVSPELLEYMQEIIEQDIKMIILTSGKTGPLGPIEDLMSLRITRLKQFGLNLKEMFGRKNLILDNLSSLKNNNPPRYKDGVIFANKNDKGDALAAFLDQVKFRPNKILFIDNQMRKIDSVKKICEKRNIDFIGIHFTRIYEIAAEPVDQDIMDKQISFLKNRMIWLTDSQARCMLDHQDDYQFCRDI